MFINGNFEVGDVVKIKNPEELDNKSYEVFHLPSSNMEDDTLLGLRNIKNKNEWDNYYRFPLELDLDYYRRKKLKKICSKLGIK